MDIKKISSDILRDLYGASRRLSMYPLGHPITQETLKKPLELLNHIFLLKHSFNIECHKDRLIAEGILLDDTVYVSGIVLDMKKHKLSNLAIFSHVQIGNLYYFLSELIARPDPRTKGLADILKSKDISAIAVNIPKTRNIFHFDGPERTAEYSAKSLDKRLKSIIAHNPSINAAYYMGRMKDDDDVLKYLETDFRLGFLSKYIKESLIMLNSESAVKLLEEVVFTTNWLDDSLDSRAVIGLKRLFNDYLSQQGDNQALMDIYQLFKKVGAPESVINQIFDRSHALKLRTFQDSEEIVNTLRFSDPSQIKPDYLKKTIFKLASAGQKEYLFDIINQLVNSITGTTRNVRQQALELLTLAGDVISGGGFFDEFGSLSRMAVKLSLMPDDIIETAELTSNLAWQALRKKRWQELKFLVRMLTGITTDKMQPQSKRDFVAKRILELRESSLLLETVNDMLEGDWDEETGGFFDATANLGSTKIIMSLVEKITSPDTNLRSRIIKILVSMNESSAEVLSQLLAEEVEKYDGRKLDEEKWYLLRNILRVLKEVNAEEALPSLEIMSGWKDNRIKLEIIKTLEGMSLAGSAKLLQKFSDDEDFEIRKTAITAMGLTGHPDMIPKLNAIIHNLPECRVMAVAALGRIGGTKARDLLIELFENEELQGTLSLSGKEVEEVRVAILKALSRIGDNKSLDKLEEYSQKKFSKSLFKKDLLSNTAKIILDNKGR